MEAVNRSLFLCAVVLSQSAFATEVQFDDLRTNFKQYAGQRVTVKGILEVAGNDNYLYRDIQGRENQRVLIHVLPDLNRPDSPGGLAPDAPLNLHWVKITGVVDPSFHGHSGNEPFALQQTQIEVLPGPRLKRFLPILAWFKNETQHDVQVEIDAGRWATSLPVDKGEVGSADLYKGRNNVSVTKDRKVFAQLKLDNLRSSRFYDRQRRACYFRITDRKIILVSRSEVRTWKFAPTPERD